MFSVYCVKLINSWMKPLFTQLCLRCDMDTTLWLWKWVSTVDKPLQGQYSSGELRNSELGEPGFNWTVFQPSLPTFILGIWISICWILFHSPHHHPLVVSIFVIIIILILLSSFSSSWEWWAHFSPVVFFLNLIPVVIKTVITPLSSFSSSGFAFCLFFDIITCTMRMMCVP